MLKLSILPIANGGMCPVAVDDGTELLLIDCGMPNTYDELKSVAELKGVDFSRLTKVLITHHDYDHLGALPLFKRDYPGIQVIASTEDASYIDGSARSFRLRMQDARLAAAPEEEKAAIREDIARAEANFTPVPVELPAEDGKVFDFCGGVEIVATPGHLPGHIAVYIRELKTIVMGDAMNTNGVSLQPANPAYTVDMAEAAKSTEKLLKYDIDQVICYHGGVFAGPVKAALAALVEGYKGM